MSTPEHTIWTATVRKSESEPFKGRTVEAPSDWDKTDVRQHLQAEGYEVGAITRQDGGGGIPADPAPARPALHSGTVKLDPAVARQLAEISGKLDELVANTSQGRSMGTIVGSILVIGVIVVLISML